MARINHAKLNFKELTKGYYSEPKWLTKELVSTRRSKEKQRAKRNLPPLPEDKINFSAFYL